jgi:hypothetical protein
VKKIETMTSDERIALIQVKIERAKKHVFDLEGAARAFFDTNPYKIGTKRDPQTRQLIYYISSVESVPTNIACIAGMLFIISGAPSIIFHSRCSFSALIETEHWGVIPIFVLGETPRITKPSLVE